MDYPNGKQVLKVVLLCLTVFIMAFYDTYTNHSLTNPINQWLLQFYADPTIGSSWQYYYHKVVTKITHLGGDLIYYFLVPLFCFLIYKRSWATIILTTISIFFILKVTFFLKQSIESPRPLLSLADNSFPSGHAARVTIWCGILLLLNKIRIINFSLFWRNTLIAIPLLVGFTRIVLGRHWLSDVVGSYALTIGILIFTGYIIHRITHYQQHYES